MMHELVKKADKLLEMSMPLLDRLTDDTDDAVPEKALEACSEMVELAHYLYELAMMKNKMYPHGDDMDEAKERTGYFNNPGKEY